MGYQHGLFTWADVSAADPAAAGTFYSSLFGWEATDQHDPDGNYIYTMFSQGGKAVAGMGKQPAEMIEQGIPAIWSSYVSVDSVDATVEKWVAAGGTVMMPAMDVFTSGRMAFVVDPEGAVVGLWQAGDHLGAGVFNVPGTMTWNELHTRDVDAARAFYETALGWEFELSGVDGQPYWLITVPGKEKGYTLAADEYNGGLFALDDSFPRDMPANWQVYFASADVDADVAKAVAMGGSIIAPAMDISAGRFAVIADPQGGIFTVMSSAQPE